MDWSDWSLVIPEGWCGIFFWSDSSQIPVGFLFRFQSNFYRVWLESGPLWSDSCPNSSWTPVHSSQTPIIYVCFLWISGHIHDQVHSGSTWSPTRLDHIGIQHVTVFGDVTHVYVYYTLVFTIHIDWAHYTVPIDWSGLESGQSRWASIKCSLKESSTSNLSSLLNLKGNSGVDIGKDRWEDKGAEHWISEPVGIIEPPAWEREGLVGGALYELPAEAWDCSRLG